MSEPIDTAKKVFASFILGDGPGLLELAHPDGRWFFPGDPRILPWAGWWRGRDMGRFVDACTDSLDYLDYVIDELIETKDGRVVVLADERCRCKATGRVFENRHCGVMRVVDGLAVEWREVADTAAMHAAFADDGLVVGGVAGVRARSTASPT